jgi:hypothetical protein
MSGKRFRPMTVSVIIPAFEAVGFLPDAIGSALAQTSPAEEVIVINDGSPASDDIERIVADFQPHVRYVRQQNGGPGAARNAGLARARGTLVAFLDADDYWAPDFLRAQLGLFDADPALELAYCDAWLCGDPRLAGRRFMELSPSRGRVTFASLLTSECNVLTSGVVARTSTLRAARGFDSALRRGQDFDLWLRLARDGVRMSYRRAPLVYRRLHDGNVSCVAKHERVIRVLSLPRWSALAAAERALVEQRLARHRAALALEHGKQAILEGRFAEARRCLASAIPGPPTWKLAAARLALTLAPGLLRRLSARRAARDRSSAEGTRTSRAGRSAPQPPAAGTRSADGHGHAG